MRYHAVRVASYADKGAPEINSEIPNKPNQNAYLLPQIGADTAENLLKFVKICGSAGATVTPPKTFLRFFLSLIHRLSFIFSYTSSIAHLPILAHMVAVRLELPLLGRSSPLRSPPLRSPPLRRFLFPALRVHILRCFLF